MFQMKNTVSFLFLIFILSFIAKPVELYACGSDSKKLKSNAAKSCCSKKSKCCSAESSKKDDNKKEKDCEGKCGKITCRVQLTNFVPNAPISIHLVEESKAFEIQTNNFQYQEITISTGFFSIWTPPNIG